MFDPLTPVVMAVTGLKRSLFSNTSCFSNLYLVECLRKYKSKSYLNSLMMTIEKDLNLAKKIPLQQNVFLATNFSEEIFLSLKTYI